MCRISLLIRFFQNQLECFFSPRLFRHSLSSFVCRSCLSWDCVLLFFDSSCSLPRLSLSVWLIISVFRNTCVSLCVCVYLCLSCLRFGSQQPSFLSFQCNYTLTKCLIPSSDICCASPCVTHRPTSVSISPLSYLSLSSLSPTDVLCYQPLHQYFNNRHSSSQGQ